MVSNALEKSKYMFMGISSRSILVTILSMNSSAAYSLNVWVVNHIDDQRKVWSLLNKMTFDQKLLKL